MPTAKKTESKARRNQPDMSALHGSLAYSLRRAQLSTYNDFSSHLDPLEIRPAQYVTLVLIRVNPGLTQSAISNALGIQKANFVTLLDRLEERGLTERRKVGGDRRSSALYLTPAGKTFVAAMEASHARMEEALLARLGKERSGELLGLLHAFSALPPEAAMEAAAGEAQAEVVPAVAASSGRPASRKRAARPAPPPPARKRSRG